MGIINYKFQIKLVQEGHVQKRWDGVLQFALFSFLYSSFPLLRLFVFISALFLFLIPEKEIQGAEWKPARPDYEWSFPQDHWARPGYRTEWWYFTGHLRSEQPPDRMFGYQFTFFRIGLLPGPLNLSSDWAAHNLIMGHASISDLTSGRHLFSEVVYREIPLLGGFNRYPDPVIAWSRGPVGTDGKWTLRWNGEGFDFAMRDDGQEMGFRFFTRPLKRMVFQGPNGYSRKGEGETAASQYYSFTRLETEGSISLRGETIRVRGESWMDKEFGSNQLGNHQVGWDWFSLQLEDGRDVMLYLLRDEGGKIDFGRGTVVSREGSTRYLKERDYSVRVTRTWVSIETGAKYPSQWIVDLPGEGLRLEVIPELADQENRGRLLGGLFYWEGAVSVKDSGGKQIGRGYVEMTGYGTKNRPGI